MNVTNLYHGNQKLIWRRITILLNDDGHCSRLLAFDDNDGQTLVTPIKLAKWHHRIRPMFTIRHDPAAFALGLDEYTNRLSVAANTSTAAPCMFYKKYVMLGLLLSCSFIHCRKNRFIRRLMIRFTYIIRQACLLLQKKKLAALLQQRMKAFRSFKPCLLSVHSNSSEMRTFINI